MRIAVLAAVVALPVLADAEPKFSDHVHKRPPRVQGPPKPAALTSISHLIYLNPCLPNGCIVRPGNDDSRTDTSSIPFQQATLTAWPHGSQKWTELVQCVKDLYGPFDIQITDVDPGPNVNHSEVMIAGVASAIGADGAGGIAPFEPCGGQLVDNAISFVFAAQTSNLDFLCWAAAQESSHVFGLDHELNAKDPMTYLAPPYKKPGFQNVASPCGEEMANPRECWCGGTTQNSYQYLMDTFGPSHLEPATLAITEPHDGAWVKPGFNIRATAMSQLSVATASLQVDGATTQSINQGTPLVFNTASDLPGGDHRIAVVATDIMNRTFSAEILVHVTERCDGGGSCASGTSCLGGYCLPGPSVPGGLGAPCTGNEDCVTGSCASDGTSSICTGACDPNSTCPAGFACMETFQGGGVCWPSGDEGGCAATSAERSPLLVLFGFGMLLLLVRRRR
jgi:hypothetical protein